MASAFTQMTKKDMKLCDLEAKSLKMFVTTKKEKKKDQNFSKMSENCLTPINNYLNGVKNNMNSNLTTQNSEVF